MAKAEAPPTPEATAVNSTQAAVQALTPTPLAPPLPMTARFGLTLDGKGNLDLPSLGVVLQQSGFFGDIERASQGMVKVMLGRELGIPAITAVIGIHILKTKDGRITVMIGSHLKAGKIKKSGVYDYDVEESTATKCTLIPKVRNADTGQWEKKKPVTFTIEQAQQMKLGGWGNDGKQAFNSNGNWSKAPEDMLFHRALGRMEKMYFPDISTVPTYTPDDLGFREDEKGEAVVIDGALIRDNDDEKVPQQPAATEATATATEEKRPKASAVWIAKLQAFSKKHKWTNEQFFDMVLAEKAVTDQALAEAALEAKNWKALTDTIAGDEDSLLRLESLLAMGPDMYLDQRSNPPEQQA